MEVFLNGEQLSGEPQGGNLQEILQFLVENRMGDDITMREVKINGQPYDQAAMGPADNIGRSGIARLEVETLETRQLALHFLANGEQFLGAIGQAAGRVAELYRVADEREASEHYLQLLDSIQLFLQMLELCRQVLGLDFDRITHEGLSAEQRLHKLSGLVQEMLASQEQEDYVLLADLLQYDLIADLEVWGRHLPALREQTLS